MNTHARTHAHSRAVEGSGSIQLTGSAPFETRFATDLRLAGPFHLQAPSVSLARLRAIGIDGNGGELRLDTKSAQLLCAPSAAQPDVECHLHSVEVSFAQPSSVLQVLGGRLWVSPNMGLPTVISGATAGAGAPEEYPSVVFGPGAHLIVHGNGQSSTTGVLRDLCGETVI